MTLKEKGHFFEMLLLTMDEAYKNKRFGKDSVAFQVHWASQLYRDCKARMNRSFRINDNFAFLTSIPKWREIFATCFNGRIADHELCDALELYFEMVLHYRTFNNRKGKGSQAAINQVIEDIYEVTEGFTKPARIIKWDLKGFFPNAVCSIIEGFFCDVIEKYRSELSFQYGDWYPDYLRWLTMVCIHANPAMHCELRTPKHYWRDHIDPEKSLFSKPEGIGAPIGRLPSQKGMGLYLNDEVIWWNEACGIRTTVFMDDGVSIVPEEAHMTALGLIPKLRERLAAKGIKLNDNKFYDQPYQHGLEFLGSHIRPNRVHLNNKTYARGIERIKDWNHVRGKQYKLERFLSTANSYIGLLKNRTDYGRILKLLNVIDKEWWKYCHYDPERKCISPNDSYTHNASLAKKYRLKPKKKRKNLHSPSQAVY